MMNFSSLIFHVKVLYCKDKMIPLTLTLENQPRFARSSKRSGMGPCMTHIGHLYHGAADRPLADLDPNAMMALLSGPNSHTTCRWPYFMSLPSRLRPSMRFLAKNTALL
jgi:hypothetical protein